MKVKVSAGLATMATLLALWLTAGGNLTPPAPTPTPTPTATATPEAGDCHVSDGCYPKPPGHGDGSTGVPPGTTLVACGGSATITTNNAVIDSCTYTGSLQVNANNVIIRNSRIHGSIATGGTGLVIEDNEIGPDPGEGCGDLVALIRWSNYTARGNYLHGNGDGFRFAGNDIDAEDNFVATCDLPLDHSDGVQGNFSGQRNTFSHNTVDLRGSTNGPNAPVFFADNSESATVTNNLLIAPPDHVAIKIHDDHNPDIGPWVITGNRLVGTALTTNTECGAASMTWTDNRQVTVDAGYEITSTGSVTNC